MFIQQGDTILRKIEFIPESAKQLIGETVIHHGATGNHHKLSGSFGIFQVGESKFVDIIEPTAYTHEEHKEIIVPPGKYALEFVQEYDHIAQIQRAVID